MMTKNLIILELLNLLGENNKTNIMLKPIKAGKTNLRCVITVENEIIAEMMIPITISGIERIDGNEIKDDIIQFNENGVKSVELKYNYEGNGSPIIEVPTIKPSIDFKVTKTGNDTFKVEYVGTTDVTAVLEVIVKVEDEEFKDTLNIVVSK